MLKVNFYIKTMKPYRLKVSPQGQITLPKKVREEAKIKNSIMLDIDTSNKLTTLTLYPEPEDWYDLVKGSGRGLWGEDIDKYIEDERNSWER